MALGLVRVVLESHGLAGSAPGRGPGAEPRRVDQVLLGSEEAPLVVALLERAGVERCRVATVVADPGRGPGGGENEPASDWLRGALRLGLRIPRPGHGETRVLQRERLAAPGGLVLCTGRLADAGALGMLALKVDALDAAAVLAGGPFELDAPPSVLGVELAGVLPAGTGGVDLALALLSRLRGVGEEVGVVEFGGSGVATLAMTERMSATWLLGAAGLPAIFPSDEATRAELAALGRDQDWRRLEAASGEGGGAWSIGLDGIEPRLAPAEDPADSRPARELEGSPVERVLLGPAATLADLARFAACLEGRGVRAGLECTVVAGSRSLLDRAAASGVAERLGAAGVTVTEGEPSAHAAGSGTGLCFGVPREAVESGRARWLVAGVEWCAAAALAGVVARPARGGAAAPVEAPGGLDPAPWMDGGTEREAAERVARPARTRGPLLSRGPVRGEVLSVLGDGVDCARLLAPGARLEGLRGRLRALAGQLLAGLDPGFAERSREHDGGFLVAGADFAGGEPRAAVAVCLAESGVRAVLALAYAPGAARTLADAGVMPLRLTQRAEPGLLERGDELELPGLPEALVPGHPLTVRNLTRGTHLTVGHELSARDIAVLRAGGSLPFVMGRAFGAGKD
jgi:aconitate hydratase